MLSRANRDALIALRNFWQVLLHQDVHFKKMSAALAAIQAESSRTDKTFKILLDRCVRSTLTFP
jgi:hypothetical protein